MASCTSHSLEFRMPLNFLNTRKAVKENSGGGEGCWALIYDFILF